MVMGKECMNPYWLYLPNLIFVTRKSFAVLDFKSQDALNILPFLIRHIDERILNLLNITT